MAKLKEYRARLYIYLISGLLLGLSIWLLALHALALSTYSITLVNFFAAEKNAQIDYTFSQPHAGLIISEPPAVRSALVLRVMSPPPLLPRQLAVGYDDRPLLTTSVGAAPRVLTLLLPNSSYVQQYTHTIGIDVEAARAPRDSRQLGMLFDDIYARPLANPYLYTLFITIVPILLIFIPIILFRMPAIVSGATILIFSAALYTNEIVFLALYVILWAIVLKERNSFGTKAIILFRSAWATLSAYTPETYRDTAEYAAGGNIRYIPALDGLRGIAILLVILFHFEYIASGWIGVQIFFVLSGYLITQILLRSRQAPLNIYLKRFYWRRALRIFPIYFGYLLLITLCFLFSGKPTLFRDNYLYLYSYTYNFTRLLPSWRHSPLFTHFWSLSVEEQFYLVWPIILYCIPGRVLEKFVVVAIAISPIFRVIYVETLKYWNVPDFAIADSVYWFTLCQLDAFACGAGVALFQFRMKKSWLLFYAVCGLTLMLGLVNFVTLYLEKRAIPISSLGYPHPGTMLAHAQYIWGYTLLNLCAAACIICVVHNDPKFGLLRREFLVRVGKISYGMYIFHFPIKALFDAVISYEPMTLKGLFVFLIYFAAVISVAWVSFTYFESYFIGLKNTRFGTPVQRELSARTEIS
jgi:peptidoglycan/LPS O-acetylase OafA/YrhL